VKPSLFRSTLRELDTLVEGARTPLQNLEHLLHPWVAYGVMPLFALANAGVVFENVRPELLFEPVTLGVIVGLFLGKPLGIGLFSLAVVKAGMAELPSPMSWGQLTGAAVLSGIGFTMSLFIASLAFVEPVLLTQAKVAVLAASSAAGVVGLLFLWISSRA